MEREKPNDIQPTTPTPSREKQARPTHLFYKRHDDGSLTPTTPSFNEDVVVVRIVDIPRGKMNPSNERPVLPHPPTPRIKQ